MVISSSNESRVAMHLYIKHTVFSITVLLLIKSVVQAKTEVTVDQKHLLSSKDAIEGLSFKQWHDYEGLPTIDNEIDNPKEPFKSQRDYSCGRAIANSRYRDSMQREFNYKLSSPRSKYRPLEIRMPRIIGGDETEPGEFPWTASVKLNGQPICGGSLINKSWILTAAHCVVGYNPKNLTVRLGAYRIKDTSETQTLDLPVSMFIVHKEYSMPRPFSNDIALLKLEEPVEFTDFIIPICLPTEDHVTTSTSAVVIDDYSNKFAIDRSSDDSGGIVVSTKMSDHDIAKCFTELEQNYFSSIGLGGPTSKEPSSAPIATIDTPRDTTARPQPSVSQLLSSPDILNTLVIDPDQQQHQGISYQISDHQDSGIHKVSFKPTDQQFKPSAAMITINKPPNSYNRYDYVYYDLPWTSKSNKPKPKATKTELKSRNLPAVDHESSRRDLIKLSRLPISKELLHEIQSVGSNAMTELSLGFHKNELAAIANDLTGDSRAPSQDVSMNTNVRETIGQGEGEGYSTSVERLSNGPGRHLIRSTNIEEKDDPLKYSGLSGIVVGWGWIKESDSEDSQVNTKGYPSVTLQKVKLPILKNNVCEAWFQSQSKKITLLPSQFCAGFNSGGKDACRGDSGGPMIIEDNSDTGRFKLIGIVSAGIGCARPSLPGLYTRVASFLPWINAQIVKF